MEKRIYSDSWHQVANLELQILHDVKIFKQFYRDRKWYVLQDRYSNRFFRVTPEAYDFLMLLNGSGAVGAIWLESLKNNAEDTPTQDEVISLLSHLHSSNLLYFKNQSNTEAMFDRLIDKEKRELKAQISSFLFLRIPLWNPESVLKKLKPLIDIVFTFKMFVVWVVCGVFAAKIVFENLDKISVQTQGVLAPSNLVFLYLCLISLKFLHEAGHAMMTKRFGGTVNSTGIMLLILTPIPYMDASSSWAFNNKYQRILVGAAGMLVELFIAFLAVFVWINTGDGLVHSLAFNVMLIGSVSSLVFNGNPLLKFDSYFMLSDYLEIPNLYERSRIQSYYFVEKFIFGIKENLSPTSDGFMESFWLVLYGILSSLYRILVSLSIVLFVADQWFLLGSLTAIIAVYTWGLKPLSSYLKYLFTDQKLRLNRLRAISITGTCVIAIVCSISLVPFYKSIRAQGVVESHSYSSIYSPIEGIIKTIYVKNGQSVKTGDPIVLLSNYDLDLQLAKYKSQLAEVQALLTQAIGSKVADLKPIRKRQESIHNQIRVLKEKQASTLIKAEQSGIFVSHDLLVLKDTWINNRHKIGKIVDQSKYKFLAVVPQDSAYDLFTTKDIKGEIRMYGSAKHLVNALDVKVIPFEQDELPSASLGWKAGGQTSTQDSDTTGTKTKESFFLVKASLSNIEVFNKEVLYHRKRGELRISLPSEPIAHQVYKSIKQVVQKRYNL